ncbi:ArsR/SmtB family transcription factor [Bacillus massilinigeriensis]|uniref:ArsR/SmtB family transcription factor n=1 Tax=Bacillus mediterraneensis TaxID=1805474 RepID=UPI001F1964AC|nr:metalloregulator ArsR/SmtB family transcription factor [Bacillus mediterraneensis]
MEIERGAVLLKLLGDRTRLSMFKILESRDCCVCEFTAIFEMSQPAVSQHIRKLKDAGLVTESRKSQWIYYSLNKESEFYPLMQDILSHFPSQEENLKNSLQITCD